MNTVYNMYRHYIRGKAVVETIPLVMSDFLWHAYSYYMLCVKCERAPYKKVNVYQNTGNGKAGNGKAVYAYWYKVLLMFFPFSKVCHRKERARRSQVCQGWKT